MSIGVALLGAGIFALEHHLPALTACPNLTLKALYSRSQKTAEAALPSISPSSSIDIYFDSPSPTSQQTLSALLQRSDIQAVIIALPILVQPDVVRKAMAAGKHILSEKPIAKDMATAQELRTFHQQFDTIWAVGENFRFWPEVEKAFAVLREQRGELVTFGVKFSTLVDEKDKYFQTEWRAEPGYQGGFLLDGGIHFIAILRYLLGALGQQITSLSAFSTLLQDRLKPVDTIHAIAQTSNARSGLFDVSFGTKFNDGFEVVVVTDKCSVAVRPKEVVTRSLDGAGKEVVRKEEVVPSFGVVEEVAAFAEAILTGNLDQRISPEEALGDLTMLEAMLRSGESGGVVVKVR